MNPGEDFLVRLANWTEVICTCPSSVGLGIGALNVTCRSKDAPVKSDYNHAGKLCSVSKLSSHPMDPALQNMAAN